MTTEENKRLVRRQFDEIWNAGKWDSVEKLFSPDYVNHDPYNPKSGHGTRKLPGAGQRLSKCAARLRPQDRAADR
jgi:hypothetical protein